MESGENPLQSVAFVEAQLRGRQHRLGISNNRVVPAAAGVSLVPASLDGHERMHQSQPKPAPVQPCRLTATGEPQFPATFAATGDEASSLRTSGRPPAKSA